MQVCPCAWEVSRDWYPRKEGKYQIFIAKLIATFSCCVMEKRKRCHCPLKGPVTYLPLICLSLWVGEQPPKSPGMSLPGHLVAGELSEALVSWNLWKCVTCCAKSVGGLLWRPYVSLQTERWFSEVHFLKDWPHYPREQLLKHMDCQDSLLVSNMSLILLFSESRGEDGEEGRQVGLNVAWPCGNNKSWNCSVWELSLM